MRFPVYWTRVANDKETVFARGWSDVSLAEAKANADARLARILNCLRKSKPEDLDLYSYEVDHVICEEVIDRVIDDSGRELAVISRNGYGAIVMNASQLMFVDIDFPVVRKPRQWLSWLFGKSKEEPVDPEVAVTDRVRAWHATHSEIGLRVYRTLAGVRLMIINRVFDASESGTLSIMRELHCDELYITLCRSQKCFRARLSPKPWRVGIQSPKPMFPHTVEEGRSRFSAWLSEYIQRSKDFKVCRFMYSLGATDSLPQHKELIALHDRLCCNEAELPLA